MRAELFGAQLDRQLGVVLLPGLFAGGWIWDPTVQFLQNKGVGGIRFLDAFADIPPIGDPISFLTSTIRDAMKVSPFRSFVVCGNSLGGLLSLDIICSGDSLVSGAVASGSPGFGATSDLGLAAKRFFTIADADKVIGLLFHDPSCVTRTQTEASLSYFQNKRKLLNIAKYMRAAQSAHMMSRIALLRTQVLLVWGRFDRVTPLDAMNFPKCIKPNLDLRVVDECGHSPMIERPEEFNPLLHDYICAVRERIAAPRSLDELVV